MAGNGQVYVTQVKSSHLSFGSLFPGLEKFSIHVLQVDSNLDFYQPSMCFRKSDVHALRGSPE